MPLRQIHTTTTPTAMRTLICAALLAATTVVCQAQQAAPTAAVAAEALLMKDADTFMDIWIIAATETSIRFLESKVDTDYTDMKIATARSIYLKEPKDFTKAIDLFQGHKFEEAKRQFGLLKQRYQFMEKMPGNFSALSAFYEMECMRQLGDLEGVNTAMQRFIPDPLQREWQRQQVEIYPFWDAVRTKGWARVDAMAKEKVGVHLPADLRAQIAYCHGLALEALKKPNEALNAYNTAITANCGADETITRQSSLNCMRILKADPEVQKAIRLWNTPDEVKYASGRVRLLEASAMAHYYQKYIGTLPPENNSLLKYKEEDEKSTGTAPVKADAEKEKKDEKAKDEKKEPAKKPAKKK